MPRTPAEQLASGHMQGGLSAITPVVESYNNNTKAQGSTEPSRRRKTQVEETIKALEKIQGLQKEQIQKKEREKEAKAAAARNAILGTMAMESVVHSPLDRSVKLGFNVYTNAPYAIHRAIQAGSARRTRISEKFVEKVNNTKAQVQKSEKPEPKPEAESSAEYTYTYETDEGEAEDGDEGQEDPDEKDPLMSQTLEEYYQKRVFIFIHHFAGPADPLTTAMRNESLKQGIRLKAYSVEKESGTGDLLGR